VQNFKSVRILGTHIKGLLFLLSMVIQYGVTVRDYIKENKMMGKVYEREKDKFGGEKG